MSFVVRALLGGVSVALPAIAQAQTAPAPAAPAPAAAPLRVYMRNEGPPLTYAARPESGPGRPTWCISPCDARLSPGDYRLELNGVHVRDTVNLRQPGTLRGEYESNSGTRSAAWLALNVGGIIGGVFITVGAASSSPTGYALGGGVLAGATAIFFITYRADRAKVSFTPDPPADVRDMPVPAGAGDARRAALEPGAPGGPARGLGFRVAF